jgi:hypothetical protein
MAVSCSEALPFFRVRPIFSRRYMAAGHLPLRLSALYTEVLPSRSRYYREVGGFTLGGQVLDPSAFPAKGVGLGKAQMGQHAKSEFARHLI